MRFSIAACVVLGFLPSYADHSPETNQVISIEIGDGYVIEQLSTGEECSIVTCDISVDQDGIATSNELVPDLPVLPGDESTTNAFAVTLLEMLQISAVDNFDQTDENGVPYTTQPVVPTWTWDGFLGKDETDGWTRVAKKACFDWYLNFMATNACAFTFAQTNLSATAIDQCRDLAYTNAWTSLMGIARNVHAPWRDCAGVLAVKFVPEINDIASFGLGVYTNSIHFADKGRRNVLCAYFDRLATQPGAIPAVYMNEIIRHGSRECDAAMSLDRLLSAKVSGYEISSNRLAAAVAVLNNPYSWEFQNSYFVNVTNQLLNAGRPLVRLELP